VREQPEQHAPPVQRLRIRYAKRGRLRFTSHRDFSRAFERALVRARIPMAYSSGFNPHPRISYAGAAPTGAASEAEFLEIGLAETVSPADLGTALDAALPDGLDVVEVVEAQAGSLADRLEASRWRIDLPDAALDEVERATSAFLATSTVSVERMTKKGVRAFDCRAAVLAVETAPYDGGVRLEVVIRHTEPAVRPDDVLTGLAQVGASQAGTPLLTRLAQGPYDPADGSIGDPLSR
jgi:radical SAM-linked protein